MTIVQPVLKMGEYCLRIIILHFDKMAQSVGDPEYTDCISAES